MSKELTKKAVELLLKGARLVSDPCPYCNGVRIINNGSALCVNCGREGKNENIVPTITENTKNETPINKLDQKLKDLTEELQQETDHGKQQEIIHLINEIIAIKEKLDNL